MHTKHDINILSAMEFNTIEQLCKLLSPLKEITEYLSGSTYVTNSIVFPAFYFLVKKVRI